MGGLDWNCAHLGFLLNHQFSFTGSWIRRGLAGFKTCPIDSCSSPPLCDTISSMKDYHILKSEAVKLRKGGLSYGEIKKKINVSKSTLSFWLKDVELTEEQKKKFYTTQILNLSRGAPGQKERRLREIEQIIKNAEYEIDSIAFETYRLFGAALYWAEGNKRSNMGITNSDPYLILFMVKWFEKMFDVPRSRLKAWLNIYPQQNDVEIKKFWSDLTGIPLENFGKSFIKPLSKNYKKNNLYYGTIKVGVKKGTDLRHRIFGWIKAAMRDTAPKVEFTQQEWKKLREVSRAVNV